MGLALWRAKVWRGAEAGGMVAASAGSVVDVVVEDKSGKWKACRGNLDRTEGARKKNGVVVVTGAEVGGNCRPSPGTGGRTESRYPNCRSESQCLPSRNRRINSHTSRSPPRCYLTYLGRVTL